jgi:hypothetical protein
VANVNGELNSVTSYSGESAKNLMAVAQTTLAEQTKSLVTSGTAITLADTANFQANLVAAQEAIAHNPTRMT